LARKAFVSSKPVAAITFKAAKVNLILSDNVKYYI
jgi:hypothetical protein